METRPIWARAPAASSASVRRRMQMVRRKDTMPEVALRSALHQLGLRFRKNLRPVT
ncbi:MAG: very short patch repair endonuclease, partial [Planctomycetes bacterium]|nr:very short patch repair endonuclease [Planctomycetota bacterium]